MAKRTVRKRKKAPEMRSVVDKESSRRLSMIGKFGMLSIIEQIDNTLDLESLCQDLTQESMDSICDTVISAPSLSSTVLSSTNKGSDIIKKVKFNQDEIYQAHSALKLLGLLSASHGSEIFDLFFASPENVSSLLAALGASQAFLRHEALGLLRALLTTEKRSEIFGILCFSGGVETLLDFVMDSCEINGERISVEMALEILSLMTRDEKCRKYMREISMSKILFECISQIYDSGNFFFIPHLLEIEGNFSETNFQVLSEISSDMQVPQTIRASAIFFVASSLSIETLPFLWKFFVSEILDDPEISDSVVSLVVEAVKFPDALGSLVFVAPGAPLLALVDRLALPVGMRSMAAIIRASDVARRLLLDFPQGRPVFQQLKLFGTPEALETLCFWTMASDEACQRLIPDVTFVWNLEISSDVISACLYCILLDSSRLLTVEQVRRLDSLLEISNTKISDQFRSFLSEVKPVLKRKLLTSYFRVSEASETALLAACQSEIEALTAENKRLMKLLGERSVRPNFRLMKEALDAQRLLNAVLSTENAKLKVKEQLMRAEFAAELERQASRPSRRASF